MVKYARSGSNVIFGFGTTGGTVADIPNWGVSVLAGTAAETYTLAPPVPGVEKTLIVHPATSGTARVVELSTTSSGDSVVALGATGEATATEMAFTSTSMMVVRLIGLTTAQWKVISVSTGAINGSTAVVLQAS